VRLRPAQIAKRRLGCRRQRACARGRFGRRAIVEGLPLRVRKTGDRPLFAYDRERSGARERALDGDDRSAVVVAAAAGLRRECGCPLAAAAPALFLRRTA
jgi:hypothetical protein